MDTLPKYLVMLHDDVLKEDVDAITTGLVKAGGQITSEYSSTSNTFGALITNDYKQVLDDRSHPLGSKVMKIELDTLVRVH
ncbi:hypothetical protein RSOLAG1IB_09519 [Rhizoctonia solani AG-1 IB]|uniref:Inhibitor I9 domain-containing protein n=2 Tax=Rhizoctonia solani TaxID=456999 RepID=M5CDZ8_THACB|nr:unnamed protein product [Rhizoctonia solani]CCO34087.1 hypothetical protein BN14_08179 [Rhizoctonia solani AG-1 IB]CEL60295.1 hypothetical protein RSOLAG1IB_09519 [Rhizoctonia solani AG-1 IB]